MRKLPRLTNSDIITIKTRPETIRAKSNGRMGFAPLFEEERRKKIKMLRNVVKIMKNKAQTTTTTTSSTTTTSTTTTTATTIKRIKDLNPNHGEAGRKSARRPFTRTTTARTTTTRTTTTTTRTTNARTTTTTTTTITTTTTTTSTTTHKITTIRPIIKSPEELLGLPEIPEQLVVSDLISISHNNAPKFELFSHCYISIFRFVNCVQSMSTLMLYEMIQQNASKFLE